MSVTILHDAVASKSWAQAVTEFAAGWGGAHLPKVAQATQFIYSRLMLGGAHQVADTAALSALLVADIDALLTRDDVDLVSITVLSDDDGEIRTYVWKTGDTTAENLPYIVAPDAGNGRWFALPNTLDAQNWDLVSLRAFDEHSLSAAAADRVTNLDVETDFTGINTIPANTIVRDTQEIRIRRTFVVPSDNSTDTLTLKVYLGATVVASFAAFNAAAGDELDVDVALRVLTTGATGTLDGVGKVTKQTGAFETVYTDGVTFDFTGPLVVKASAEWSVAHANNQVDQRYSELHIGGLS